MLVTGCTELTARRAIQQGNRDYGEGKYDEAVKQFEKAISLAPDIDVAYHNAALAYLKDMRPGMATPEEKAKAAKAAENFEKYLAMNKAKPEDELEGVTKMLVKTYVDSEDYDGALAVWQRELDKDPNNINAVMNLARINTMADRYAKSIELYRKAFSMAKEEAEKIQPLFAIGAMQNARLRGGMEITGTERLAIADIGIAATQDAIEIQPDNYQLWYLAGSLFEQRSLTYEVYWLRNIDLNDAYQHRIKGAEIYKAQQAKAAAEVGAGDAGSKDKKDGDKSSDSK